MSITAAEPFPGGNVGASRDRTQPAERAPGADRRAARRAVSMSLLLLSLLTLVSGIWSLVLARGSIVVPLHAAMGTLFLLLSIAHIRFNRNAVRLYVRDLGWPPAALRLVIAAAISIALLVPVLRLA